MSLGLFTRYGLTVASGAFSPDDIAGLQLWLDASDASTIDDTGGAVSQWDDKSGNARHVLQGTGSLQPTTGSNTINARNAVTFAGDRMAVVAGQRTQFNFLHKTASTVFLVAQVGTADRHGNIGSFLGTQRLTANDTGWVLYPYDTGSSDSQLWFYSANGSVGVISNRSANRYVIGAIPYLFTLATDPTDATAADRSLIWRDGANLLQTNVSTGAASASDCSYAFTVGDVGPSGFTGLIAEVLVYNSALVPADIDLVEGYLATKWGITL